MIARNDTANDGADIWSKLADPLPADDMSFRQDGKPSARGNQFFARFVAYWDWPTFFRRFQSVVPGEFDVTLERLEPGPAADADSACAFKCRIQVLGVIRENVGYGKDVKQAATDAMKRTASLGYGVGLEVYDAEPFWVQVDGDGRYAKPVEDVRAAYLRKNAPGAAPHPADTAASPASRPEGSTAGQFPAPERNNVVTGTAPAGEPAACPKCGGKCYDNRAENDQRAARGEKLRPDFACRDRACNGVIWRPDGKKKGGASASSAKQAVSVGEVPGLDDGYDGY